jgi:hypothetical protein
MGAAFASTCIKNRSEERNTCVDGAGEGEGEEEVRVESTGNVAGQHGKKILKGQAKSNKIREVAPTHSRDVQWCGAVPVSKERPVVPEDAKQNRDAKRDAMPF